MKHRTRRLRWKIVLGWLAANGWIVGHAEMPRSPVTSAMVVQALHLRGVEINAANVHLPMLLYVSNSESALAVLGAERETETRLRLQLRCVKASDCVAFTATLDASGESAAEILSLATPAGHVDLEKGRARQVAMLHAGEPVALSMQQKHLVLQMPCLAVDTGSMGDTIRVSTLDHRRIFRAVVTGPASVTGVSQ